MKKVRNQKGWEIVGMKLNGPPDDTITNESAGHLGSLHETVFMSVQRDTSYWSVLSLSAKYGDVRKPTIRFTRFIYIFIYLFIHSLIHLIIRLSIQSCFHSLSSYVSFMFYKQRSSVYVIHRESHTFLAWIKRRQKTWCMADRQRDGVKSFVNSVYC